MSVFGSTIGTCTINADAFSSFLSSLFSSVLSSLLPMITYDFCIYFFMLS